MSTFENVNTFQNTQINYFLSSIKNLKIVHGLGQVCNVLILVSTRREFFFEIIKSNLNKIAYTILWFIWNQTDVRLVPNQSENGKYNLISAWFNKISKRFLCVYKGQMDWKSLKYNETGPDGVIPRKKNYVRCQMLSQGELYVVVLSIGAQFIKTINL